MSQAWNAELYEQRHRFVSDYGAGVVALLDAQPGERILDVGCGIGHHAKALAEAGALPVGIDSSPAMIAAARAAYPDLEFVVADASDFAFPQPFDAVFSNAALHWVTAAEQAVACMARALRPGGRLVAELGGRGNVAAISAAIDEARAFFGLPAAPRIWYFPSVGAYAGLLEAHGLEVRTALLFDRPSQLSEGERGMANWLAMFGGRLLEDIPADLAPAAIARIEDRLRPDFFRDGHWFADYRRLRIVAVKQ